MSVSDISAHLFELRGPCAEDFPLIMDSFQKSYPKARKIKAGRKEFVRYHRDLLERILALSTTEVKVICRRSDANDIAGWLAHTPLPETGVIHYAYVKHALRPFRLFEDLLRSARVEGKDIAYTFGSRFASSLADSLVKRGWFQSASSLRAEDFLKQFGDDEVVPKETNGKAQIRLH